MKTSDVDVLGELRGRLSEVDSILELADAEACDRKTLSDSILAAQRLLQGCIAICDGKRPETG